MSLKQPPARIIENRKRAAQLLDAVLDERLVPQLAINRWPEAQEQPDPSLSIAYQALWHFEADEDKQQGELFYLDAQLELLQQMARYLAQGQPLPAYMLKQYSNEHQVRFLDDAPPWKDLFRAPVQWWWQWQATWQQAWELARAPLENCFVKLLAMQKPPQI